MKKIIFLTYSMDIGGVQKSLISLLNSIDSNQYSIDLLCINDGELSSQIPSNVNILKKDDCYNWLMIPKNGIIQSTLKHAKNPYIIFWVMYYVLRGVVKGNMGVSRQLLFEKLKKYVPSIEGEYDLAIDYSGQFRNILIDKVTAKSKVSWVHSDYRVYKSDKKLDLHYLKKINHIVTVSETAERILEQEFPLLSDKISVIYNITNQEHLKKLSSSYYPEEFHKKDFKIVDITRIEKNKGLELALKAAKLLKESGFKFKWYIIGDGPYFKKINSLIIKMDMQSSFFLLGKRSNPYPYIENSNLFVHSSYFEGKSVAIDEAKLLSIPVVVTNYPTAKDQITHLYNGVIVEMEPKSIYEGIVNITGNSKLYENIKSNLKSKNSASEESIKQFYTLF